MTFEKRCNPLRNWLQAKPIYRGILRQSKKIIIDAIAEIESLSEKTPIFDLVLKKHTEKPLWDTKTF